MYTCGVFLRSSIWGFLLIFWIKLEWGLHMRSILGYKTAHISRTVEDIEKRKMDEIFGFSKASCVLSLLSIGWILLEWGLCSSLKYEIALILRTVEDIKKWRKFSGFSKGNCVLRILSIGWIKLKSGCACAVPWNVNRSYLKNRWRYRKTGKICGFS